jgi:hypothetical protein
LQANPEVARIPPVHQQVIKDTMFKTVAAMKWDFTTTGVTVTDEKGLVTPIPSDGFTSVGRAIGTVESIDDKGGKHKAAIELKSDDVLILTNLDPHADPQLRTVTLKRVR